jgi:lysophospholipase L1-like esterase
MGIDIEKTAPAYDREKLGALLPFYRKSDHLKNAVLSRGQNEKIKTFCSVYPFNSTVYQILRNNWWPLNNDIKGYIPINKTWNKEIALVSEESNELDSLKIAALFDFVEKCQQSHCKILIAISPHFVLKSSNPGIDKMASAIQDKFGIKILNLEQDSFFLGDKMLFADPFHLNAKGADLYSSVIAMKAKELISNMESHR